MATGTTRSCRREGQLSHVICARRLSDVAAAFALARYDSNGGLDHSFGIDGIRTTGLPGQLANMTALILQPGGKLVAVGEGRARAGNDPSDFVVVRYQPNGREDTTFGDDVIDDLGNPGDEGVPDGFKVTHFGPPNSTSTWQGVAIDPQGDIVTVGHQRPDSGDRDGPDFALGRYKASVIPPNFDLPGPDTDGDRHAGRRHPGRHIRRRCHPWPGGQ